jgi:hypothetical protein
VHRDDRSFVVIASSWQTERITDLDTRRPTPPPPPLLPCMVYGVCRVVVYVMYHSAGSKKKMVASDLLESKREKKPEGGKQAQSISISTSISIPPPLA